MLLTSTSFLLRFLPAFLFVYYCLSGFFKGKTQRRFRNLVLLFGSILFYAGGFGFSNLFSLLILLLSVTVNYLFGLAVGATSPSYVPRFARDRQLRVHSPWRCFWLFWGVLFNAGLLILFKYIPYLLKVLASWSALAGSAVQLSLAEAAQATQTWTLPLGISFYTFSAISYLADVFRGEKAERDPLAIASYLLFFPKVLQGPIHRYAPFRQELSHRKTDFRLMEQGLGNFILGLAFQVLLSGKIGTLWTKVWTFGAGGVGTLTAWLGAWGYSFQLYFDFMGYSLMAIGLAEMLGFTLPDNFDSPYAATSASDFWRRWHITLGAWFRDYVYIPLGGSRNGTVRLLLSLTVTWLMTGIWHGTGVNFLLWAGLFLVLLILERFVYGKLLKKVPVLGHLYMLLVIPVSWMLFTLSKLSQLGPFLKRMFFLPLENSVVSSPLFGFADMLRSYWWLLALCILFSTPYPLRLFKKYRHSWVVRLLLVALFWVTLWQLVKTGSNPFMYLNF